MKWKWKCPLSFGQYIYKISLKIVQTIVGIPMGTTCTPLVTDLFWFCNKRDFMLHLSLRFKFTTLQSRDYMQF